MNLFTKRLGLVLAGVVGVGAIASLAIGASFALFTGTAPQQSNTFTAGTLALTACGVSTYHGGETTTEDGTTPGTVPSNCADSTSTITSTVSGLEPGDTKSTNYVLQLASGSEPAFVEVNISWTSTATTLAANGGTGCATDVSDCTNAGSQPLFYTGAYGDTLSSNDNDLAGNTSSNEYQELWAVFDNQTPFDNTCAVNTSGASTGDWTCSGTASDIEVFDNQNPYGGTSTDWWQGASSPIWTAGDSQPLILTTSIPKTQGNGIQGVSGNVKIQGFAVQSGNNTTNYGSCASGTTLGYFNPPSSDAPSTYECPSAWS
ncbi:MAG: hypothetical protein ACREN7_02070 [Candidatus Dormibacteria bacterium]